MGADYVKYDVVYPMPLVQVPSKYTNSEGNLLKLRFAYDMGYRLDSYFEIEFGIYKEAHWEVIVVFAEGAPEFRDYE